MQWKLISDKISGLEPNIFELKMMVTSDLDFFFILKFYYPLQSYLLTCQANSAFLGNWATLKGLLEFQNKTFRTTFHHFLLINVGFQS